MGRIRVFISSSLTELESEREIAQETISQLNLEPVMFEEFPAMNKTLDDACLDSIKTSHIFVIILWKDVTDAVEAEYNTAVKNGIPLLLLVKTPTHREVRSPRLQKLLDGKAEENYAHIQYVPFRKKFRTLKEFAFELKEGLMKLISDRFIAPALTTTNMEVLSKTTLSMIQNARRRILLVVKTPQLLFGPRPYFSQHKNYIEQAFYIAVTSWIEEIKKDKNRRLLYLYSVEDTYDEMKEYKLEKIAEQNLEKFKKIEDETEGRFHLASIPEFPGRILVTDNSFGIQFRAPKGQVFCVFREDASIAVNLYEVLQEYRGVRNKTLEELRDELQLA